MNTKDALRGWVTAGLLVAAFLSAPPAGAAESTEGLKNTGRVETGGAHSAAQDPIAAAWHGSAGGYTPPAHADAGTDSDSLSRTHARGAVRKPFAIEANPLGLLMGHYSAQLEWVPARRSSIVVNPFFDHAAVDDTFGDLPVTTTYTGFGGELGYHYFYYAPHQGEVGAEGLYLGPAVMAGYYGVKGGSGFGGHRRGARRGRSIPHRTGHPRGRGLRHPVPREPR